ncbi:MAG: hypothetical protein L0154_13660, partial [Chloroflexi bacterium]|nr:hypothetical protein [Chloroflexota bacterium]
RLPQWQPMDAETRDYAIDLIAAGLAETNPNRIAACLYGDEIVAEQGHEGIGLPPYAGFEVASEVA